MILPITLSPPDHRSPQSPKVYIKVNLSTEPIGVTLEVSCFSHFFFFIKPLLEYMIPVKMEDLELTHTSFWIVEWTSTYIYTNAQRRLQCAKYLAAKKLWKRRTWMSIWRKQVPRILLSNQEKSNDCEE